MNNQRFAIARPINGISINENEYLLDEDGETLLVNSVKEGKDLLMKNGIYDFDSIDFINVIGTCIVCDKPVLIGDSWLEYLGNVIHNKCYELMVAQKDELVDDYLANEGYHEKDDAEIFKLAIQEGEKDD